MKHVRFDEVVHRANTKEDRFNTDKIYYVGGEHINSEDVLIEDRGIIEGSTIGPMFYFGFKKGDVLYVSRNPHLRKAGMVTFDGICSEKTFVLETNDEKILLQKYLPFVLQTENFWNYVEAHKSGSVNYFVNWSALAKYEFNLPDIEDQKKISEALWAVVETKKAYHNMIHTIDELVISKFYDMFGMLDSTELGSIAEISSGQSSPHDDEFDEEGIPFIKAGNLEELKLFKCSEMECNLVSEEIAKKKKLKLKEAGTVLVAKSGMSCLSGHIYSLKEDAYVVSHLACIKPIEGKSTTEFIKGFLVATGTKKLINDPSYPSIQLGQFEEIKIPDAPYEKQLEYSRFLKKCEHSKYELTQAIQSLDVVYKGILFRNFN